MKKKIAMASDCFNNLNIFVCPYCHEKLFIDKNCLKCKNNHTFNFKKNGSICLIKTNKYIKSKFYDKNLFSKRRRFIEKNYYEDIYNEIIKIIKNRYNNDFIMLDLGCGDGTHSEKITKEFKKAKLIGIDYSKDGVDLATDYLNSKNCYIVGDVNNIPLQDKSIDIVINFLSPYNTSEIHRILKDNGVFIKIIPSENYLIELRKLFNLPDYIDEHNIKSKFNIENEFIISNTFENLSIDDKNYLYSSTPLTWKQETDSKNIEKITISLKIIVCTK